LNGESLPGKCSLAVKAGDRLLVRTPGGGGWGKPDWAVSSLSGQWSAV